LSEEIGDENERGLSEPTLASANDTPRTIKIATIAMVISLFTKTLSMRQTLATSSPIARAHPSVDGVNFNQYAHGLVKLFTDSSVTSITALASAPECRAINLHQ
jgi:hypothetical protein